MICKYCGQPVDSGVVLHRGCYEEIVKEFESTSAGFDDAMELVHRRNDKIKELQAECERLREQIPNWISVEDDLPELDEYGYSKDVYVTDGEYVEHAFLYKAGNELFWSCTAEIDIFFWCEDLPMPVPPKESAK